MNLRTIGLIPVWLACMLALPFASLAQPAAKVHRIGILNINSFSGPAGRAFFDRLNQLGYVEGKNLMVALRFPEGKVGWADLAAELAPAVTRIAVLWDPGYSGFAADWKALREAALVLGVTLLPIEAHGPDQWEAAFVAIAGQRADGLMAMQDANTFSHAQRLADLAGRSRLPAVFPYDVNSRAGGLMSYGVNLPDMMAHATTFIDRILQGAKPGDLPVEQPTRFEMIVNMKTAKALGITIPQALLLRADEVIR
jgi:hypothetical protein